MQQPSIQTINLVGPAAVVDPRATVSGVGSSSSAAFIDQQLSSARQPNNQNLQIVNSGGDYFPLNMSRVGGLPGGAAAASAAPGGGGGHIVNINFNGANQSIT